MADPPHHPTYIKGKEAHQNGVPKSHIPIMDKADTAIWIAGWNSEELNRVSKRWKNKQTVVVSD